MGNKAKYAAGAAFAAAASAQTQRQRESEQLQERCRDLELQRQQHEQDMGRKQGLASALNDKQTSLQADFQRLRAQEEHLSGEIEAVRLESAAAAEAVTEKRLALDELRRRHDELATKQSLLQELQTNMEGIAEGARQLIASGRPGILGGLAEGLKVNPGYERAIAAALGGDVAEPDGTVTRRDAGAGEAILKRQHALEALTEEVRVAAGQLHSSERVHSSLLEVAQRLANHLVELEEEGRKRAAARQQCAAQMRELGQQLQAAQAQVDWLASLKEQVEEQTSPLGLRRAAMLAEEDQEAGRIVELQNQVEQRQAELMKWGLVPSWSKTGRMDFATINAKCETAATSATYRRRRLSWFSPTPLSCWLRRRAPPLPKSLV